MSEALILNELTVRDIWNNSRASTQSPRLGKQPPRGVGKGCAAAEGLGFNGLQQSELVLCVL